MRIAAWVVLGLVVIAVGYAIVSTTILNPRVLRELETDPDGDRARRVMRLTLPSGRAIPVNYILDETPSGKTVYAAADFPWWRPLRGEGARVRVLIRGTEYGGRARAVQDDPALRASVFERLRPTAPSWTGVLVAIPLDPPG